MPRIADRMVRRPEIRDVRVRIFGPLEARLQNVDRLVLGGLNEGTWPRETRSDPGCPVRCAAISASTRPSAASDCRRTISRRR